MATDSKQQPKDKIAAKLEGRSRVVIEKVQPEINYGEFPIQRVVDETVTVEADIFADGHDAVSPQLSIAAQRERTWRVTPMQPIGNDRWQAQFTVTEFGEYRYTVEGWVDAFTTWRNAMKKRIDAGQETHVERMAGHLWSPPPQSAQKRGCSAPERIFNKTERPRPAGCFRRVSRSSAQNPDAHLCRPHLQHPLCERTQRQRRP